VATVAADVMEDVVTPARFCRGFRMHREELVASGRVVPSDPDRWARQQLVLEWLAQQEQMTEERFEEVLADRSIHADKEDVRTICTVLLEEWRNEPMRQFWTAQA